MSTQVGAIHVDLDLDDDKYHKGVKNVDRSNQSLNKSFGVAKKAAMGLALALAAVTAGAVAFGVSSVKAYNESLEAQTKLSTNLLNVKGNTEANVKAIQKLASELQKKGVIEDDAIIAGASQLATFNLQGKSIEKLTPKIADMAAQLYGANASSEQMMNLNNLIGKVMTGNVGALTKYGVTLSEHQKELLKTGNETERAALLAEVLGQNFGSVNEALANTPQGKMAQLRNQIGELKEKVGEFLAKALQPVMKYLLEKVLPKLEELWQRIEPPLKRLGLWIQANLFPILKDFFGWISNLDGKFLLIMGTLALLIPIVIGFASALLAVSWPAVAIGLAIGAIVLAIGGFIYWLTELYNKNEWFRQLVQQTWEQIKKIIKEAWEQDIKPALEQLKEKWDELVASVRKLLEENPRIEKMLKFIGIAGAILLLAALKASVFAVGSMIYFLSYAIQAVEIALKIVLPVMNFFLSIWQKIWDVVKAVGSAIGDVGSTIKKTFSGGWIPQGPSFRAAGGPVSSGQPYIVGEQGPEMFIPSNSGKILSNEDTTASGSGGGQVYISIDASGIMATSRAHQRQVISTLIEAANEELIGRGFDPIAENKLRAAV